MHTLSSHLLQVPENAKVPSSFDFVAQRKGFKRYSSEELKELVRDLDAAKEAREAAMAGILQV